MRVFPSPSVLMPIALQLFVDKSSHSFNETQAFLRLRCDLREEIYPEEFSLEEGKKWMQRVKSTWLGLQKFELTERIGGESAVITGFGVEVAANRPRAITKTYLRKTFGRFFGDERMVGGKESRGLPKYDIVVDELRSLKSTETRDPGHSKDPRDVLVWYGTNRKRRNEKFPSQGYGEERNSVTHFGKAYVNIPEGHKVGKKGPGIFARWMKGGSGIVLRSIDELARDQFSSQLDSSLSEQVQDNSLLLFLHGYNQSFEAAAIATAQLKYDLKIPHAAFFSWPSRGTLPDYPADGASVDAAVPAIADFLSFLSDATKDRSVKLHIVAHSMGNRGLLAALQRILLVGGQESEMKFDSIVFAAADVDRDCFKDGVELTGRLSGLKTLYASDGDRALLASGVARRVSRAGFLPPIMVADQVHTVDASGFDFTFVGHGYVRTARPVLHDMYVSMHFGTEPDQRQGLQRRETADGVYWRLT